MIHVQMLPNRQLHAFNYSTLLATEAMQLAQLNISDISQPYTNNILAYRPRYNDGHGSGLGAIFINMESVFPCLAQLSNYIPICSIFSQDGDGFRGGKAIIDSGDVGNHFQIFSTTAYIATYGIAIQQCPELNTTCFPTYHDISVACYLPRAACSETV